MEHITAHVTPELRAKLAELSALLEQAPKVLAHQLFDDFLALLDSNNLESSPSGSSSASGTGHCVLWLRIGGLDELIAAARGASNDE